MFILTSTFAYCTQLKPASTNSCSTLKWTQSIQNSVFLQTIKCLTFSEIGKKNRKEEKSVYIKQKNKTYKTKKDGWSSVTHIQTFTLNKLLLHVRNHHTHSCSGLFVRESRHEGARCEGWEPVLVW